MRITREATTFWNKTDDVVRGLAHWRSASRWGSDAIWQEIGIDVYKLLSHWLLEYSVDFKELTIADYGCGGGAVTQHLCREFKHVYGIDISSDTLNECCNQVGENFTPVWIEINNPEASLDIGKVDVFLSVSTFQHFPDKEYGRRILKLAHAMTDKYAFIQVRYDDGLPGFGTKTENYADNVTTFTSYKMSEFGGICRQTGFKVLHSARIPTCNYEYVFLAKETNGRHDC